MSVVVSIQDVGPCRKQLTIEVPAPEVEAERSKVLAELGRTVRVPGFRKGKVPAGILRQRYGESVDREIIDRLVPRYWRLAQEESRLEPLLAPELEEVADLASGEPFTFVAIVETRPEIEIGGLDGFELPDPPVEPGEEEVREVVDDLRRQAGPWVEAERPASRGDRVTAEVTELPDSGPEAGEEAAPDPQEIDIEVGDPRVWEELSLAVTGLGPGQEARFSHRDPRSAAAEGPAPAERHFRVRVQAVQERELPPLDDDFAKSVGAFATVDELLSHVRERLTSQKQMERRDQRRKTLLEQLRGRHPLTLPQGVVRHETEDILREYAENLARQGVDIEKASIDWDRVRQEASPQAERRVHDRLLLDAVADKESITVDDDELERALAVLARAQGTSVPVVRRALEDADRLGAFRRQLRRDKTVRRLLGDEPDDEPGTSPAAE